MNVPVFDIGDHVLIEPLEGMAGRVVELIRTAEEGWIYVVRYFINGEAKTMRCFPDEIVVPETPDRSWRHA